MLPENGSLRGGVFTVHTRTVSEWGRQMTSTNSIHRGPRWTHRMGPDEKEESNGDTMEDKVE